MLMGIYILKETMRLIYNLLSPYSSKMLSTVMLAYTVTRAMLVFQIKSKHNDYKSTSKAHFTLDTRFLN